MNFKNKNIQRLADLLGVEPGDEFSIVVASRDGKAWDMYFGPFIDGLAEVDCVNTLAGRSDVHSAICVWFGNSEAE